MRYMYLVCLKLAMGQDIYNYILNNLLLEYACPPMLCMYSVFPYIIDELCSGPILVFFLNHVSFLFIMALASFYIAL